MTSSFEDKHFPTENRSFHKSITFLLRFANCLGLLPLNNLSVSNVRSEWKSLKGFYAIFNSIIFALNIISSFRELSATKFNFSLLVKVLHQFNAFFSIILYFKLAKKWPKFLYLWNNLDKIMNDKYGYSNGVDKRIKITTLIAIFGIIGEIILLVIYKCAQIRKFNGELNIEIYYTVFYYEFFSLLPFNFFSALFVSFFDVVGKLIWCFNDLFIVVLSTIYALRFRQIKDRLNADQRKAKANSYWIEIRADYDRLVHLTKKFDRYFSFIILLAYSTNVLFLLLQLSNVIQHFQYPEQIAYYSYAFFFLIVRMVSVSLSGAWIIDESREPANCLHSIPSATYNLEIRRLLLQISFDDVGITGSKMFKVTRGLLLNIAGAIVTYELVLIQFASTAGLK